MLVRPSNDEMIVLSDGSFRIVMFYMEIVSLNSLISEYSLRGFLIMGGILLNAAVGAMLWRPVETIDARPRALSSTTRALLPVPSLSAKTPNTANEQSVTPLMQDAAAAARYELEASAILPEVRVPFESRLPIL